LGKVQLCGHHSQKAGDPARIMRLFIEAVCQLEPGDAALAKSAGFGSP
jgi:hypothetical protein